MLPKLVVLFPLVTLMALPARAQHSSFAIVTLPLFCDVLPLQFSHRFFVFVVICLALTTIYGEVFAGVGGPHPKFGVRGMLPGSYWGFEGCVSSVRCRTPLHPAHELLVR